VRYDRRKSDTPEDIGEKLLRSDFGEKPVDESRCGTCPFSDAFSAHFTKVLGTAA